MIRTCDDRAPSWYLCHSMYALHVDGKVVGLVHAGQVRTTREDAMREFYGQHPHWTWVKGVMDSHTKRELGVGEGGGNIKGSKGGNAKGRERETLDSRRSDMLSST